MPGRPFFVEPVTLGSVLASAGDQAGRPVAHLGAFQALGAVWGSTSGTTWIRGQLASAQAIDTVALLGTSANASTTWRIRLGDNQAQVDGAAPYDSGTVTMAATTPIPAFTPSGVHGLFLLPNVQTRQWWRIDISHASAFTAAALVMGAKVQTQRWYETAYDRGPEDLGSVDLSRNGILSRQIGGRTRNINFDLAWVTETEARDTLGPLLHRAGNSNPILLVFDPDPGAQRMDSMHFGELSGRHSVSKWASGRWKSTVTIRSRI